MNNSLVFLAGYHNYLISGFVSCYCKGVVPDGRSIIGAALKLRTSRIYGTNPFTNPAFDNRMRVDMVGGAY